MILGCVYNSVSFRASLAAAAAHWLHKSWLLSTRTIQPSGSSWKEKQQADLEEKKKSELYKRFWLKFGKKCSFRLFISSQKTSFFSFPHSANCSSALPSCLNLILLPFLGPPYCHGPSHSVIWDPFFFLKFVSLHPFFLLTYSLSIFPQRWGPRLILLIFLSISSCPCPSNECL